MKRYANAIIFSPDLMHAVVLTKLHGPAFLLGRINFPGGHIEEGETPAQAASRECKEEADLTIPVQDWSLVRHVVFKDAELFTYCAICADIFSAKSMTDEVIEVRMLPAALAEALQFPERYCPDFLSLVAGAVEKQRDVLRAAAVAM
jgi:8-oxo-dGTP pyrophosphatase MutT (NUDIX family)